jgi:hypothetical protein
MLLDATSEGAVAGLLCGSGQLSGGVTRTIPPCHRDECVTGTGRQLRLILTEQETAKEAHMRRSPSSLVKSPSNLGLSLQDVDWSTESLALKSKQIGRILMSNKLGGAYNSASQVPSLCDVCQSNFEQSQADVICNHNITSLLTSGDARLAAEIHMPASRIARCCQQAEQSARTTTTEERGSNLGWEVEGKQSCSDFLAPCFAPATSTCTCIISGLLVPSMERSCSSKVEKNRVLVSPRPASKCF